MSLSSTQRRCEFAMPGGQSVDRSASLSGQKVEGPCQCKVSFVVATAFKSVMRCARSLSIRAASDSECPFRHRQFGQEKCKFKRFKSVHTVSAEPRRLAWFSLATYPFREGHGLTLPSSGLAYGHPLKSNVRRISCSLPLKSSTQRKRLAVAP